MLNTLLNAFFGCSHRRTTFPLTPARRGGSPSSTSPRHGTYVTCLDCGREFAYNWDEMRIGDAVNPRLLTPSTESLSTAHR